MKPKLFKTVLLITALTSIAIRANELVPREQSPNDDQRHWLVGAVLVVEDSAYRDVSTTIFPVPYLAWETKNLHLGTDEIQYDFLRANSDTTGIDLTLSLVADPRFGTPDPDDDSTLEELSRELAFEAGLEATLEFGPLFLSSTTMADLSGVHDGLWSSLEFGLEAPLGGGVLEFSVAATYQNSPLGQYLYGVSTDEASAELTRYQPDESWKTSIEGSYLYPLSESSVLVTGFSVHFLDSAASDSPRLDSDLQLQGYCGLIWKF